MIPRLSLVGALLACLSVQVIDGTEFSRHVPVCNDVWKLSSFVKGGRNVLPPTSVSSFVLQVRGGSDRGGDPGGYYPDDDDYKRRPSDNDRYSSNPPDYEYQEPPQQRNRQNDDYYSQDRNYYEDDRRYERDYDYDDRGTRRGSSPAVKSLSSIPSLIKNGDRTLGAALLTFGAFFTISGIFLFFHKTLLRMGNLLIIAGVPMTIGPGRTAGYFFQPQKARATGFLVFGIFLVFIGWPIFGMALEIFGLMNLFGNMLPMAMAVLRQMPIVNMVVPSKKKRRDDDDRYSYGQQDDDRYYGGQQRDDDDPYY